MDILQYQRNIKKKNQDYKLAQLMILQYLMVIKLILFQQSLKGGEE